jgi:agmatine deiminase
MVIDKETNFVYLSEKLETDDKFRANCNAITKIFDKYGIQYEFLKGTKDIWARDYMPVQKSMNDFVQFRYEPSYLENDLHLQSDPKIVCKANKIDLIYSEINLDGGNVVKWFNKLLITDRIYSENPKYTDKEKLVKEIENLLETEVIIIPQIKSDFTGHADGLVKFISETTILGNDLNSEFKYWSTGMKSVLDKYKLEYINMPFFEHKDRKYPYSAIGCYINYLEIGNVIVFPIFEIAGNKDKQAVDLIKSIYPDKTIETININEIARQGGLMNCITWNIKN